MSVRKKMIEEIRSEKTEGGAKESPPVKAIVETTGGTPRKTLSISHCRSCGRRLEGVK